MRATFLGHELAGQGAVRDGASRLDAKLCTCYGGCPGLVCCVKPCPPHAPAVVVCASAVPVGVGRGERALFVEMLAEVTDNEDDAEPPVTFNVHLDGRAHATGHAVVAPGALKAILNNGVVSALPWRPERELLWAPACAIASHAAAVVACLSEQDVLQARLPIEGVADGAVVVVSVFAANAANSAFYGDEDESGSDDDRSDVDDVF